jgi:hypothetical protein
MIETILASKAWSIIRPLLPYIAIGLAVAGFYLWVTGMQHTIAKQNAQINTLAVNLRAEQVARSKDVAGLTVLAKGTAAIAVDTARDATALQETVSAQNAKPSSPELAAFLGRLRDADSAAAVVQAAK